MALPTIQDILPGFPGWFTLAPSYGDISSGQGNGTTIVKSVRPMLWGGHGASRTLSPNRLRHWKGTLAGLDNGKRLFLGYDFTAFYPLNYPRGTWPTGGAFNGATATLSAIGGDGASITVANLPAGYSGSVGDMLSITYGDDGNLALVIANEDFLASGAGVTPSFAVSGDLPAGLAEGDLVSVKRPSCHMMIAPGSAKFPDDETVWGKFSFDALQVPTL